MTLAELSSVAADQFDRDLIYFMHRGGMSAAAIARALEVSYGRVLRTLRPPVSKHTSKDETIRN
jgi:hypothetical protein